MCNCLVYFVPVCARMCGRPCHARIRYAALDCGITVDEIDGFESIPSQPQQPIQHPPTGVNPFSDPEPTEVQYSTTSAAQAAANATASQQDTTDRDV